MARYGLLTGAAAGLAMAATAGFAQAPAAAPAFTLFGTIAPASVLVTTDNICDTPTLISSYVPFAPSSSQYYKDAAGVHIDFQQPVDYFSQAKGQAAKDVNLGGWALLKFTSATAGTVSLDYVPWVFNYKTNVWSRTSGFDLKFSNYASTYASGVLKVSFKMTAQGCALPIAATFHNFGQ